MDGVKPIGIQLRRTKGWKLPPNTVVVSRPSKWGNLFKVGSWYTVYPDGSVRPQGDDPPDSLNVRVVKNAEESVSLYRKWIGEKPGVDFSKLRGKNLGCWCEIGMPCHRDVLLELANKEAM